ncbi:hypothetical protein BHM03_00015890 [Ensete ventricosum]|uniref:DCD domain-containing protein n=1 Tax=Ensete ventricosum TaxID=4639 RepID=A0A445MEK4_ENSVE|nr:hypothetical protein BHM03_00015890 [Ensete ventricosum]
MDGLWKLGDEFRGQTKISEDHQWSVMTSKLAELTRSKVDRRNNLDYPRNIIEAKPYDKVGFQEDNNFENLNLGLMNLDVKMNDASVKSLFHGAFSMSNAYQKSNSNDVNSFKLGTAINKYAKNSSNKDFNNYNKNDGNSINNNNSNSNNNNVVDKRFKTLPSTEMLPRNEVLGGYIFVCNNDTMQEDLKRQLFGMIFVRIRVRKLCKPLEEDAFRPVLHHYDGPKFRLELSISEVHLLHLLLCGSSSCLHYDSDLKFCHRRKQDVSWFT